MYPETLYKRKVVLHGCLAREVNRTVHDILGRLNDLVGGVASQITVNAALQTSLDRR